MFECLRSLSKEIVAVIGFSIFVLGTKIKEFEETDAIGISKSELRKLGAYW